MRLLVTAAEPDVFARVLGVAATCIAQGMGVVLATGKKRLSPWFKITSEEARLSKP
ncbi:hypothetical protein [Nonomuraea turcica]|uniref:hypothetical protein n=1 Tax=Nonomuraea sp. G32 TaxID=3067274 RepID=UPI00273B1728|nr:hypothetical protein [Nonomuraea sp. G32]MDP4511013.1 hypothetical protein [Nonomuraea sp. G32]